MPSILSRLRTRAASPSSRNSAQSVVPTPAATITVTTPTHMERSTGEEPIHEEESAPNSRKIYPDIDRLTDDFAAEPMKIRHGLPPPVRRGLLSSSNHPTPARRPGHKPDASSAPTAAKRDSDSPKASQSSSSEGNNTPSASASGRGFIERLGNWSTFGRHRVPPPSLNEFGEEIQISPSPSAWRTRRTNSRRSSRLSSKTTSLHSSPAENKENTPRLSSQSSLARRTPGAASVAVATAARPNSQRRISALVARELGFDSPRTLGHPSPEAIALSDSPLPLPAPGLHSQPMTATFPPRAWTARASKNNEGAATGEFTFGKSLRPYRSLPRVQHIFRTRLNKGGDEDNEQREGDAAAEDSDGDQGKVPVPTIASWPGARPINDLAQLLNPPSSSSSSPLSSSPSSNPTAILAPVGLVHAHDPIAPNLYDPGNISLFDNVVGMQQDAPRVHDKKPLRSSLKASARPPPTPIASSSSSNTGASALMPSFSLVAATAAASDTAPHQTPLSSPDRSETSKGKRKAEDVDITPPDSKKATFAVPGAPHVFFLFHNCVVYVMPCSRR